MSMMVLPERMTKAAQDWNSGVTRLSKPNGKEFLPAGPLRRLLAVAAERGLPEVVSAETVAALEAHMRHEGCSKTAINLNMARLRSYARYTGEGLEWAEATGQRRCSISEEALPAGMRRYLKTCSSGEVGGMSSALRMLVETAVEQGFATKLSVATGNALTARLRERGWSDQSLTSLKAKLRKYSFASGEGLDWSIDSAGYDQRKVALILQDPIWNAYREVARALLADGHPEHAVKIVDRWLRHRRALGDVAVADVLRFSDKVHTIQNLTHTFSMIDPGHPDNRVLQATRTQLRRSKSPTKRDKPRFPNLPDEFVEALERIAQMPAATRPADSIVDAMASSLRRLFRSAAARNLPPTIDIGTAEAFAKDIFDDPALTNKSGQAYCDFMRRFITLSGIGMELATEFGLTRNEFAALGRYDLRRKVKALAAAPLEIVDVARKASKLLERAPDVADLRSRRRQFTLAASAALLCKLPLRSLDLRGAIVGTGLVRDSEGWNADIITSKTGTAIKGRLADCLTPYLDGLILLDVAPQHFWSVYQERVGQPLLLNPTTGKAYSENWLWSNFKGLTQHGTHIMRTLMYDECVLSDDLDILVAAALCGHASITSREFYEVNAPRYRRIEAGKQLTKLNAQFEKATFGNFQNQ